MFEIIAAIRVAAFADDLSAVGKGEGLKPWWDALAEIGPSFGYFPQPKKSWLIVKPQFEEKIREIFQGTEIQISVRGERHLGAVIGSNEYRKEYCTKIVKKWTNELKLLSEIALIHPKSAYACYVRGFQHRYNYCQRTIPGLEDCLAPLEECIRTQFIPAITGGHHVDDEERSLLSLPPRLGGLGIKNPIESAPAEFENSNDITKELQANITKRPTKINMPTTMTEANKRTNESNMETGVSNWLTSLPLKDQGYDLNKEQFWDALRIRYNWMIPRIPSECSCGAKFNLMRALSCKKGGFVSLRHNELRDMTGKLMEEVCHDVGKEPMLLELNGERFNQTTANKRPEAKLDLSANGFWTPGQRVLLDIRVFDLNAQRYKNLDIQKIFKKNEVEKKRTYGERVLQVENGTFSLLVFSANGGMGRECKTFYKRLSQMIADKPNLQYAMAANYIRAKVSFSLLRSALLCLRGARFFRREITTIDI